MKEQFDVYADIKERTGGDMYIGVVGPVRTGKSTFIKRFMELLVLPAITNEHDRQRNLFRSRLQPLRWMTKRMQISD